MTDQPFPRLHALPDVALQLGLKLRPLQERARRREFTHVRAGRERYLTPDQLEALIASMTVTSQRDDDLAETARRVQQRRTRKRAAAA